MTRDSRRNGTEIIESVGVAVVGAGPAGLAVSRRLAAAGCPHLVLERDRIGSSWRRQRWDSFRLNTPVWANRVPSRFLAGPPESFASGRSLIVALERLAKRLPVAEGVEVFSARRSGPTWRLDTSHGRVLAEAVVVASGFQNVPRTPVYAGSLPAEIRQLHAAAYRHPQEFEDGVLVVGGAQSGLQIAEDLLEAGKHVYLSTSRVGRLPRRYRGRDAFEWLRDSGQLDLPRAHAEPGMIAATPPQVSGTAGGRTVSYQHLASRGATLLGRAVGWDGRRLELAPDLGSNVRYADDASGFLRAAWEKRARLASGRVATAADHDPADLPAPNLYELRGPASLDLAATNISTVIWATGFGPSLGWLPAEALDARYRPQLPHLYVIGAPWLTHRSSSNLYGMTTDAESLVSVLADARLRAAA